MSSLKKILISLLFAVLTVAGAKVSYTLPGTIVPITLQTLAIIAAGFFLPPLYATVSIALYVVAGIFLPVFSGNLYGSIFFSGPNAGYVLFFPVAALFTSLLKDKFSSLPGMFFLAIMAHWIIVIPGGLWGVSRGFFPLDKMPFNLMWMLPATVLKSGLLALVVPQVNKQFS